MGREDGAGDGCEDGDEDEGSTDRDGDVEMASEEHAVHARALSHSHSHPLTPASSTIHRDDYPPYSAPLDAPYASSFAPRRTLSPCPVRMAASFNLRSAYPRTPSPGRSEQRQGTSRLTPSSGPRVRPVHHAAGGRASPTPSTSTRGAAWRKNARYIPRFTVEEAV